ncbi:unnamed protein product, partial [Ectocarpus sp. 8 AP-2014]
RTFPPIPPSLFMTFAFIVLPFPGTMFSHNVARALCRNMHGCAGWWSFASGSEGITLFCDMSGYKRGSTSYPTSGCGSRILFFPRDGRAVWFWWKRTRGDFPPHVCLKKWERIWWGTGE